MEGRARRADAARIDADDRASRATASPNSAKRYLRRGIRDDYLVMVGARLSSALTTSAPFVERLVHFWANHFAVSADKLPVSALAGPARVRGDPPACAGQILRHAARGRAASGDAALSRSGAVDRPELARRAVHRGAARRRSAGSTKISRAKSWSCTRSASARGYSQADVTEFARALTGWTVGGLARGPAARMLGGGATGDFQFAELIHEPGERQIMGRRYGEDGEAQARAMLDGPCRPSGDRHAHLDQARAAFRRRRSAAGDGRPAEPGLSSKSGGDLPSVYRALIDVARGVGAAAAQVQDAVGMVGVGAPRARHEQRSSRRSRARLMNQLGQPAWKPGSPAGYDDIAASWAAPDALVRRVEVGAADRGARRSPVDAARARRAVLPGALGEATRDRDRARRKPGDRARAAAGQPRIREEMRMLDSPLFPRVGGAPRLLAASLPRLAFAQRGATDRRFVFIIQRGAADGLGDRRSDRRSGIRRRPRRLRRGSRGGREARQLLHAPPGARRDRQALCRRSRRCSSMPSPRPIATARISTARTCSRPAARPRIGSRTAG